MSNKEMAITHNCPEKSVSKAILWKKAKETGHQTNLPQTPNNLHSRVTGLNGLAGLSANKS